MIGLDAGELFGDDTRGNITRETSAWRSNTAVSPTRHHTHSLVYCCPQVPGRISCGLFLRSPDPTLTALPIGTPDQRGEALGEQLSDAAVGTRKVRNPR